MHKVIRCMYSLIYMYCWFAAVHWMSFYSVKFIIIVSLAANKGSDVATGD